MNIQQQIDDIKENLPSHVHLVAVSKTKPAAAIQEAYDGGHRCFGENKVQELVEKQDILPKDIEWHFIGHLQTNKVKYMASFVDTIHAVDSLKLLKEINKQAKKHARIIRCLLQFHIAAESSKFGMDRVEAEALLSHPDVANLDHVDIVGVMGMATFTNDTAQVRQEFKNLHAIFQDLKTQFFADKPSFKEISMGMSGDYEIAVEEGSTMVRIGSTIFGHR